MGFRFGMMLGFGAGYMFGAKAGRYRYDQIMRTATKMWESPKAVGLRERGREVVEQAGGMVNGLRERTIKLDADEVEQRVDAFVTGTPPTSPL